jgi:hypothetical protein
MAQKSSHALAIGTGIAGVAAAAGAAYWLYGAKDASKHRKMAASWMLKARAEMVDALEKVENIDKSKYMRLVDDTIKKYAAHHRGGPAAAKVKRDMMAAWSHISKADKKSPKKRR